MKYPPIKIVDPLFASVRTVVPALGFHDCNAPAPVIPKAATLLRATAFAVVNVPPTYRIFDVSIAKA